MTSLHNNMNPDVQNPITQLPNAPLTEVVFELRWKLEGPDTVPLPFRNDPGYHVMADRFGALASDRGFGYAKKLTEDMQPTAYAIDWRFYERHDQPFPLWQIGPGILAVNESVSYEWNSYKKLCLRGARALAKCYPKMQKFSLKPFYLELRYVDSFSLDEKAKENLVGFLNSKTCLSLTLPAFVPEKLKELDNAQLVLNYPVKGMGETLFVVVVGSGVSQGIKTVIMQSKVITKLGESKVGHGQFVTGLSQWLEKAHDVTSPFFKEFVKDHLMKKFAGS
jgi:uncharacterized protein (TIGR04255 family)